MTWVVKQHECQLPELKEGRSGDIWRCDTCDRLWSIKRTNLFVEPLVGYSAYWRHATRKQKAAHPMPEETR